MSIMLRLTRYGEDRWGPFWFLIHTAAILNPEDVDGLRWAHGVAGEVEGCVSADIHALRLPNKVWKSCRERLEQSMS